MATHSPRTRGSQSSPQARPRAGSAPRRAIRALVVVVTGTFHQLVFFFTFQFLLRGDPSQARDMLYIYPLSLSSSAIKMEVLWESSNLSNRAITISSCPHSGRTCPRVHRRSGPRLDGEATVCCPMEALCLDQRSPMRLKSCAYAHILTEERMRTGKPKLVKIREGEDVEAVMPSLGADDHVVMSDGSPHNCKRCPVCRKTVEVGSRNRAVCNGMCSSITSGRNAPGMPTGVGKQPPHNEQPRHEPPSAPVLDAEELTEEQLQVRSNVAWMLHGMLYRMTYAAPQCQEPGLAGEGAAGPAGARGG